MSKSFVERNAAAKDSKLDDAAPSVSIAAIVARKAAARRARYVSGT